MKQLLGEKPLVLDREFSYPELMQALVTEEVHYVIRLKVGASFFDRDGQPLVLTVKKGEKRIINKAFYMGKAFVNVIGRSQQGLSEPLWVMTSPPAEQGLAIYLQRIKIERAFRDLKNLLGLEKMMHKKRELMGKIVAMMLIAHAISLVLGETLRTHLFAETRRKWQAYSCSSS